MYAVNRLRDPKFHGFRIQVLPHPLDQVAHAAVTEYTDADPSTRRAILDALTPRAAGVLSVYGERAAALAVRGCDTELLRAAGIAVGMADARLEDYRDNLIVLAALTHSAGLLQTTQEQLFDQIEAMVPPRVLARFRRYTADGPLTLRSMGLRACGDGPTFRYR
ncbi:hypothetical protein [Streptacidiphilus jiangxiensis]|uniref:Uncharacterized protein n=1 Tax=Streptacidiphilus jiangxiensis TaxID=235985 RepID=A0A1H7WAD7_STRJI|nr:hypothetical protein [Streptacidiphilus jiangxiensis]SEM18451.1 hypothetical protein SAMN05414137_12032 [Streptacidiphilus jiangxiensis]